MSTFVLIHGAMHGGWCWRAVESRLRAAGHEAHAPTLTGCGDRAHLATPAVGVGTHVDDVLAVLRMEQVHDAVLVLHSYSGVLAGPVADAAGHRLSRVVAMGAFLADPGEALADVEPPASVQRYREMAMEHGDGWRVPATSAFLEQWAVPARLRDSVGERLTDFPWRCVEEPVMYDPAPLAALACHYVEHVTPPLASLDASAARARQRGWHMHRMRTGHDMMLADPEATARLLMEIAS